MVLNLLARLLGAGGLGVAGWQIGMAASRLGSNGVEFVPWGLAFMIGGVLLGALATPYAVVQPLGKALDQLNQVSAATLMSSIIGLVLGLVIAILISIPLFNLEGWLAWGIPLILSFLLGLLGLWVGSNRANDMRRVLPGSHLGDTDSLSLTGNILVDTSAIIDGRIADLGLTGFLQGTLVIPAFVLDEIRHIADSSDSMRRNRGRRGLEVLGKLRRETSVPIQVIEAELAGGAEVDSELVKMAKTMKAPILTTDYNLNRVAELQGIQVLNVNELSNALKPMVLPGEEITVNIIQEGKEVGQGVAFLDDGTMVVVEGGRRYLNSLHDVMVTRVLQTAAGRIIFAQPKVG